MPMEKLLSAKDIMERYGCKKDTAYKYMRQMPHMENPLRVTVAALMSWEMQRTREPGEGPDGLPARPETARKLVVIQKNDGKHLIPRKRPQMI